MKPAIQLEDVIECVAEFARGNKYCVNQRYHREHTPYGFSINEETFEHYVFNRDFLVIPVQFPEILLITAMTASKSTRKDGMMGHGRLHPRHEDSTHWATYHFFHDGTAPKWVKKTVNYDKSHYE